MNNCTECIHCVVARQGHEIQKQYLCFRNPPAPFPAQVQGGVAIMSIRPVVTEADWCGEYDDGKIGGEDYAPQAIVLP